MDFTYWWIVINLVGAVVGIAFVLVWKGKGQLNDHRRIVDLIPPALSTWGVLGTFIGIAMGLSEFNTQDIDASIPKLLEGMKTAFFTSLAGMGTSLILQFIISKISDKSTKVSDIEVASGKIVEAMDAMKKSFVDQASKQDQNQVNFFKTANPLIQSMNDNLTNLANDISSLTLSVQAISSELTQLKDANTESNKRLDAITQNTSPLKSIDTNIGEITDATSGLVSGQSEMLEDVKGLGTRLHDEVMDIEEQMTKTNGMLREKFDEFSELLKKSNTEALVEVMKGVTEEFEKQMNALISRLVQENFQKLNESVERLNTWQLENKEMIKSLTTQYKEMTEQFEGTSDVLSAVGKDTKSLVSDGSKLSQIVEALDTVMVQDEKFKQVTQNLTLAVESAKDANVEFKDNAQNLTKWVLKQKDFAEAVAVLMKKLEDINKINDYSDKFWAETKKGMNDSVQVLKNGSRDLQQQINGLDQSFYSRLSATLGELDNLIVSFLNKKQ